MAARKLKIYEGAVGTGTGKEKWGEGRYDRVWASMTGSVRMGKEVYETATTVRRMFREKWAFVYPCCEQQMVSKGDFMGREGVK